MRERRTIWLALLDVERQLEGRVPAQAREAMARAYATRDTIEATLDHVLTAIPLGPADREQVITDSLRGSP